MFAIGLAAGFALGYAVRVVALDIIEPQLSDATFYSREVNSLSDMIGERWPSRLVATPSSARRLKGWIPLPPITDELTSVLAFHGRHAFALGTLITLASPGLILACGGLFAWWRRRQKTA